MIICRYFWLNEGGSSVLLVTFGFSLALAVASFISLFNIRPYSAFVFSTVTGSIYTFLLVRVNILRASGLPSSAACLMTLLSLFFDWFK